MEENIKGKNWLKIGVIIFIVLFITFSFYFAFKNQLSYQQNVSTKDTNFEKQYQEVEEKISAYESEAKKDFFGGKTPSETLSLFIKSLEAGNVEETSNYFFLDAKNTRKVWKEALEKVKNDGKLSETIEILKKAEYEEGSSSPETAWFSVKNEEGLAEYSIVLKLNKYTGVWKIAEM